MTVRLRAALAAALLVPALAAGCSSSGAGAGSGGSADSGSITVFAAASLTESFTALGAKYEAAHPGTRIAFNFGASSALATQIDQGAPADVFASASTKNMDTVVSAGDAKAAKTFAANTMEIAAAPGNPAKITGVADLAEPGVKVALCAPEVPCGATAAKVFANAGVTVKPVAVEADVKSTLAKVQLGEVDAGVVYVTDVRAAGDKVVAVPIPAAVNARTDYPIAALAGSRNAALAQAFVDYVTSPEGLAVLTAAGFSAP